MTEDSESRFKAAQAEIDLGLGGLLGELGSALNEVLSRLDEAGAGEVYREQTIDSSRGPVRASAGIRVRPLAGAASVPRQGRRPETPVTPAPNVPDPAPDPASPRAISATILDTAQSWTLVAELPGVSADNVALAQAGADLIVTASGRGRTFEGRFALPAPLTKDDLTLTMQNGILELTAAKGAAA